MVKAHGSGDSRFLDGCMGIPNTSEYCRQAWVAQIRIYAELLQLALSRRGYVRPCIQLHARLTPCCVEREMIPYCQDTGVGLIPWSPIARGALARPFDDRSTTREKSDRMLNAMIRGKETEIDKTIIGRVEEIAKKKGVSMATIATAWCLSKNSVNPIIGLSSKERIDQTVESVKFASSGKLTEEDIKYLEEGYAPKVIQGY
jgi:aryl-alcohol dehydrogenase-like predicted oxidoreductase